MWYTSFLCVTCDIPWTFVSILLAVIVILVMAKKSVRKK